jgi:hypothetical protein
MPCTQMWVFEATRVASREPLLRASIPIFQKARRNGNLRIQFEGYYSHRKGPRPMQSYFATSHLNISILATCKQLLVEGMPYFWKRNAIHGRSSHEFSYIISEAGNSFILSHIFLNVEHIILGIQMVLPFYTYTKKLFADTSVVSSTCMSYLKQHN